MFPDNPPLIGEFQIPNECKAEQLTEATSDGDGTVNVRWRDRDTILRLEFRNPRCTKMFINPKES